ncbi:MAG: trypsin-like peptidase domain-containing protein [Phycisphaerae bacterium]|nr:trypsin-like peptidase domain-containing protein [Phycisphaerae bacterium]
MIAIVAFTAALIGMSDRLLADAQSDYQKLADDKASAFVTVKFVLKMQGGFGDSENEAEITGLMIEPSGLVLCSNTALAGPRFFRRFGRATPTDIKVLIGDDTEGVEAKLLARDSELDLAWVQIKEPGDKKFTHLDLSKAATPTLGQRLLALRRMGKYFDRAVVISEGRLAGRTKKPRDLFVPGSGLDVEPGLPIFTEDGSVLGIVVMQMPDEEEMESSPMSFFDSGRDMFSGLILPCSEVIKATKRAKQAGEEDEGDDEPRAEPKDNRGNKADDEAKAEPEPKRENDSKDSEDDE